MRSLALFSTIFRELILQEIDEVAMIGEHARFWIL